jgi:glycine/D-amino acid oxidase-like deaminating enzyme/nitrite reductase/ring-hydroxylating ferredoxin subunit
MTKRDGTLPSLWQSTLSSPFNPAAVASSNLSDVIIAGAGITGITLGLLLQKAGRNVSILEAQSIGFGTTGGTTAHLNTLLDTPYPTIIKNFGSENAKKVVALTRAAIALVKENVTQYSIDCGFEDQFAYLFAQTEGQQQELDDIYQACKQLGMTANYTSSIPVNIPFNKAICVEEQAKFHPLRYVHALAGQFVSEGGTIVENCRVIACHKEGGEGVVTVETSTGNLQTHAMVFATHIPTGINLLHLRCSPFRSYAMAVELESNSYPNNLIYDMYDPYHYYRTQTIDGVNYLIVGGEDHRTGDESNTNGCFLKLESHIRSHFDVKTIHNRWSSQYFEPADGLPYIGHLPGNPENVFVATGYGGNGITYSHVAALVLKSLILKEESEYTSLFAPGRVKPVAGFTEFVKHNTEVVKQFVGRWLGQEDLPEIADLSPGDAKVVKYEKTSIALYKDEQHTLHAVNPACTHMKCSVNWNAAEKSWDCPCHGARYDYEGRVITGPASKDLEPVEIKQLEEKEK